MEKSQHDLWHFKTKHPILTFPEGEVEGEFAVLQENVDAFGNLVSILRDGEYHIVIAMQRDVKLYDPKSNGLLFLTSSVELPDDPHNLYTLYIDVDKVYHAITKNINGEVVHHRVFYTVEPFETIKGKYREDILNYCLSTPPTPEDKVTYADVFLHFKHVVEVLELTGIEHLLNRNEGWDVFYIDGGSADGECHIQKLDEEDNFEDDFEAIRFVYKQAQLGSERHLKSLRNVYRFPQAREILIQAVGPQVKELIKNKQDEQK